MEISAELNKIYIPAGDSHKGQNGRLLIIGGSHLFHAASLWALQVASRIVDLVHYSSVAENNRIVEKLKTEFRNGIVVPREEIEEYIEEDDCILIGPGMVRSEGVEERIRNSRLSGIHDAVDAHSSQTASGQVLSIKEILEIDDEGLQTYYLTKYLLQKYPQKRWVIDAGALQMLDPEWIPENAILTPHHKELEQLYIKKQKSPPKADQPLAEKIKNTNKISNIDEQVIDLAKKYNCVVLLKGETDIIASKDKLETIKGGNAGMTKGGTGDVLAGLVAALYCKNDSWTSAVSASFINKKAGEDLYEKMGYWFNASDLADQIPETMKRLLMDH